MESVLEAAVNEWHASVNDGDLERSARAVGDPVVVLGPRGAGPITPEQFADWVERSGIKLVPRSWHPVGERLMVVEEDATMGVFCRRWGVPLIDGGTVRLPRLIGHSRAMDMILTGRAVVADEALAIGLANRVVPKGQARQAAEELAAQLAGLPQQCMRADRLSALHQWGLPEAEALDHEFASISRVAAEATEGAGRFAAGAGRHGTKA